MCFNQRYVARPMPASAISDDTIISVISRPACSSGSRSSTGVHSSIAMPASAPVVTGCPQFVALNTGVEPGAKRVMAAERVRDADVAGENRAEGQHDQRGRHRPGGIMQVRTVRCTVRRVRSVRMVPVRTVRVRVCTVPCAPVHRVHRETLLAMERQVDEAEHVGGRQERRQDAHPHSTWWPSTKVSNRISSFEKKPDSNGTPAIATEAITNVQ